MIGIKTIFRVLADLVVTNSTALVSTGLTSPIAANQRVHFRAWVPVQVGATGGVRAQVVVPAAGTDYAVTVKLYNTVTPSLTTAFQAASAAFTNALAAAGTHWLEIEGDIINGANAGNIDIQLAQNTADALSLTALRGGFMSVENMGAA